MKVTAEEYSSLFKLPGAGIPIDAAVLEQIQNSHAGLSIFQTGTVIDNGLFELIPGGTAYVLSVAICNDSARIIRPVQAQIAMPWPELDFHWLEDPFRKVPREHTYSLPRNAPDGFEREAVLNHRLGEKSRLYPSDHTEGLLLGVGREPIPHKFADHQSVQAQLTIFDHRGNRYSLGMELMVHREKKLQRIAPQLERLQTSLLSVRASEARKRTDRRLSRRLRRRNGTRFPRTKSVCRQ